MSEIIDEALLGRLQQLELPSVPNEKNTFIILHKAGDGVKAPKSFNFQVYRNKKGRLSLVTNDRHTLDLLLRGESLSELQARRTILIDDSGWGFPLGGVLCGAYDSETHEFHVREVEVAYFQGTNWESRAYLGRFRERAIELLESINPPRETTLIKICTGFINTEAKDALREKGFRVAITEVGEPLQSWLEAEHKRYVGGMIGSDIYYDPKELQEGKIPKAYEQAVEFARAHNLSHLLKSGWRSLSKEGVHDGTPP